MTTTTITRPGHVSSTTLLRATIAVLVLAGLLVAAFIVGRVTHGDSVHVVRSVTTSFVTPQVACHVGRPC